MAPSSPPALLTNGEIARRLNVPLHRVEYVLRTRGVRPVGRAGQLRIFREPDVAFVADELRRIDEERSGGLQ